MNKNDGAGVGVVQAKRRYSPPAMLSAKKVVIHGNPEKMSITTSLVERTNLSMRMWMRRFTLLTNAFSKKLEKHMRAVSFYFMVYNFLKNPLQHQDDARNGSRRDRLPVEHGRRYLADDGDGGLTVLIRAFCADDFNEFRNVAAPNMQVGHARWPVVRFDAIHVH